jgi:hypothetical protein
VNHEETKMNYDENPNDSALMQEMRVAASQLVTPAPPPLAVIAGRGRARKRQRLAAFSGLGVTGVAAATALALSLTGAPAAPPASSTGAVQAETPSSPGTSASTVQTDAFILTSNRNGTVTLTLTMSQILDAATLQQALTRHGIPALVKTGIYCSSSPAAPDPVSAGVLSTVMPTGPHTMVPARSAPAPSELKQMAARTATVINPGALPPGTELFFGYSTTIRAVFTDLIYTNAYTCSSNP